MPARPDPASLDAHPLYRLIRWCVRASWMSCAIGMIAMVPALMFLSTTLVTIARLGLGGCFVAAFAALVFAVPLTARMDRYTSPAPATLGARADALVAALLADLLDDA